MGFALLAHSLLFALIYHFRLLSPIVYTFRVKLFRHCAYTEAYNSLLLAFTIIVIQKI